MKGQKKTNPNILLFVASSRILKDIATSQAATETKDIATDMNSQGLGQGDPTCKSMGW